MVYQTNNGRRDPETEWWEHTWREREVLFRKEFGQTLPPDTVTAFFWEDIDVRIPGGCALTFAIDQKGRKGIMTLGHGLSQPLSLEESSPNRPSGYGWEFAVITPDQNQWRLDVVSQLMTYVRQSNRRIEPGHRVPFTFFETGDKQIVAELGKAAPRSDARRIENVVSMMFFPILSHPSGFQTSTGKFGVLIGTTIMATELCFAKEVSSAHLLLLLLQCEVGQMSQIDRPPVSESSDGIDRWRWIKDLPMKEVESRLHEHAQDLHFKV